MTPDLPTPRVLPVRLLISNVFVVQQERTIIVDSGSPGNAKTIAHCLERHGIAPHDVSLILLTHGHVDHIGSARHLKEITGAPIAIHPADAAACRNGHNPPLHPSGLGGRLLHPFLPQECDPFEPDLLIDDGTRLEVFGVAGHILATPGHTAGSISVLLDGGEFVAGDLLMGGVLGGYVAARHPGLTYFIDDLEQNLASIRTLLEHPITTGYVGHGGPLEARHIRAKFGKPAGQQRVEPRV
jgi:hydroxyacylglutathione hydrolase